MQGRRDDETSSRCLRIGQCVQTITGMEPHIMVIGMPQFIICVIMSQHILSMSMLIALIGTIMQFMP